MAIVPVGEDLTVPISVEAGISLTNACSRKVLEGWTAKAASSDNNYGALLEFQLPYSDLSR